MSGTPRPEKRRRPPTAVARETVSFHVSSDSMRVVDVLVDAEVYANRSHAVDAALKLLIAFNVDRLREAVPA